MKKRKTLIQNTIIPNELYVERSADTQIRDIINDMGRPGYILVSRQMGKTNLLIHAKRTLQKRDDIFAYIDLSNRYTDDRECFRSIIDIILETNQEKLGDLEFEIIRERESTNLIAHREHGKELRKIINNISGKLIINLDEIDSLTAADYSDKIFAQIRSVYFERVNFKEYERLSYVISGVAEPSEIIKDKSISPFNIGQKIILGDFNKEEFNNFIEKSDLAIDNAVKDRIFYWTNGNPRLTWELCSKVEDFIIDNQEILEIDIDVIVQELFLTTFDRPPVDHIRSLVTDDKSLREGVEKIHQKQADFLDDSLKTKLYLAGIISSEFENGIVRIKNKIVEQSLHPDWISQIKLKSSLSLATAEEFFNAQEYQKSSEIYSGILLEDSFSPTEKQHARWRLGACFFNLGKFSQVISCYSNNLFDKKGFRDLYLEQIYLLALSHLYLKQYEPSISLFDEVISEDTGNYRYRSLLNKGAAITGMGEEDAAEKTLRINIDVIKELKEMEEVDQELLSSAYYNVAAVSAKSDAMKSYSYFMMSYEACVGSHKLKPLIGALVVKFDQFDKIWPMFFSCFSETKPILDSECLNSNLDFKLTDIYDLSVLLHDNSRFVELDLFLSFVKDNCLVDQSGYAGILFNTAMTALGSNKHDTFRSFLSKITALDRNFYEPKFVYLSHKYIYYYDSKSEDSSVSYFKGFQNYTSRVDYIDLVLFERKIVESINSYKMDEADYYSSLLIQHFEVSQPEDDKISLARIYFLKLHTIKDQNVLNEAAIELDNLLKSADVDNSSNPVINLDVIRDLKKRVGSIVISTTVIQQAKSIKIGRNDTVEVVYKDGQLVKRKYKHVEADIKSGLCTLK